MSLNTLEDSIRLEKELVDSIKKSTRQHSFFILKKVALTFVTPYAAFMIVWLATNAARTYVATQYNDSSLNTTSLISSVFLMVMATFFAWRWAEKRFGGVALIGRLLGVSAAVLKVERQIDTAKQNNQLMPEDAAEIERLSYAAWDVYTKAMHDSGIQLNNSN